MVNEKQQEASYLHRALSRVLLELEDEELNASITKLRGARLDDRGALLALTRIDAIRRVRERIVSNLREDVGT